MIHNSGGPHAFIETTVTAPVVMLTGFFHGILMIVAVLCAFNAMRAWIRCRRNPVDYSVGTAFIYFTMSLVLTGLLLIDQFVGFEKAF